MTTEQHLAAWRTDGLITAQQEAALAAIVRKDRFSVFLELNALLYVGVLSIAAGVGWTVYDHFVRLGDLLILVSLAAIFAGCLWYCFAREANKTFAFDYVLYLGCLTFAVAVGYVEFRFSLLKANWDAYLLASAVLYFALAYRFDNRFVLALALSTLAGWFGVRLTEWRVLRGSVRDLMLVYGVLVAALGTALHRAGLKPHFLDAYLHVAANAILAALASGTMDPTASGVWVVALPVIAAATIALGATYSRFTFVVYGFLYGYVGLTIQILPHVPGDSGKLAYVVVSALAVIGALVALARRRGVA